MKWTRGLRLRQLWRKINEKSPSTVHVLKGFSLTNGMVVLGLHPITIQKLQARLHSNLDGSSLAHAIQVPMDPLLEENTMRNILGILKRKKAEGESCIKKL